MNTRRLLSAVKVSALACLVLSTLQARATDFVFTQIGYTGGGSISGSFSATDVNSNGQISSFLFNEVTNFSMSFSGNSLVGAFSHGFTDLFGLVYDLGSGSIGDGTSLDMEGLASNRNTGAGYDYASGMGPLQILGGRIIDTATGAVTSTTQQITVSVVPEPGTMIMLLGGIAFLHRRLRKGA